MSDLEALDEIYETSRLPAGSPCHPSQARVRRKFMFRFTHGQRLSRKFGGGKHKSPAPTLAKLNLPEVPAE